MKSSSTLLVLAATCLVSVQAHTMLVCSATSCKTPGRVTVFLGTYHNEPRNANAGQSPGGINITTMAGKSYDFKFASTCETIQNPTPRGTDNFATLENSFRAAVGPYSSNSAPRACSGQLEKGKPIIDEESIISCYNGDLMEDGQIRRTPLGVKMAAEWTDSGKTFCAFPNLPLHGFYYMTMDNVLPGDYTISGWTTDWILAHQGGSGVCAVVGFNSNEEAAKSAGETYAFSLSVATQQCAANLRCHKPSDWGITGLDETSTDICDKTNGVLPGYMCNAKCRSGFTQVGSMVCGDDGQWTGFSCHANQEQTTKPCSIADVSGIVTNAGSLQYDAKKGCGYMSTHNAECEISCTKGVKIGGALKCDNGIWKNTQFTECREVVDVILSPPHSISASLQADGSIKVTWATATACSTGPYCSGAFKYDFVVTSQDGEEATLGCSDYNNGVAPAGGITCTPPQGTLFEGAVYNIRVRAQNDKGWSQPSAAATVGKLPWSQRDQCKPELCEQWSCNDHDRDVGSWCACWKEGVEYPLCPEIDDDEQCDCSGEMSGVTERGTDPVNTASPVNNHFYHMKMFGNAKDSHLTTGAIYVSHGDAYAESDIEFQRPIDITVMMKQDTSVDGEVPKHMAQCGVVQVFPQANTRHTGYNAGTNWWGDQFGTGVDGAIAGRGSMGTNGFEWNTVRINAKTDGHVDYYLNGKLMYTQVDNQYQSGKIRLGHGCMGYEFNDLTINSNYVDYTATETK